MPRDWIVVAAFGREKGNLASLSPASLNYLRENLPRAHELSTLIAAIHQTTAGKAGLISNPSKTEDNHPA